MKSYRYAVRIFGTAAIGLAGFGCAAAPQTVSTITSPVPPAATPTPANMLGVAPGGAPPGPVTVWQKLGVGKQQMEFCRRRMCDSPAGMLMGRAIAPMSKLTGGIIPPFCSPIPTAAELLDPGAIGANSKVKQDKANAEKRKKAIEELASVDCHYWPEAEDALIGGLRADRNECVRHAAALALNRGCCCTKNTINALIVCVSGSDSDGHPCEKSPRVRAAAAIALEACLERACCPACPIPDNAVPVDPKGREEKPKAPTTPNGREENPNKVSWTKPGPEPEEIDRETAIRKTAKAYYDREGKKSMEEILAKARQVLATMPPLPLDLSIPVGHPDYEAAGVHTTGFSESGPRKANVLDMLSGRSNQANTAMLQSTVTVVKHAPTATAEPPAMKAKPVEVAVKTPVEKVKVTEIKPAMATPTSVSVKATAAASGAPVTPLVMPMPAANVPAARAPVSKPVEVTVPKAMPSSATSSGARVLKMLDEPSDLGDLCRSINSLSTTDIKEQPKLTVALLKAAEYPSDTGLRVACLKAVARSREKTKDVASGLERISHDSDPAVAAEASRIIVEIKAGR